MKIPNLNSPDTQWTVVSEPLEIRNGRWHGGFRFPPGSAAKVTAHNVLFVSATTNRK